MSLYLGIDTSNYTTSLALYDDATKQMFRRQKLLPVKPLKEQGFIRNKRGELDLTKYKDFITKEPTGLRLVRGNMIGGNALRDVNHEYVLPEFIYGKS